LRYTPIIPVARDFRNEIKSAQFSASPAFPKTHRDRTMANAQFKKDFCRYDSPAENTGSLESAKAPAPGRRWLPR